MGCEPRRLSVTCGLGGRVVRLAVAGILVRIAREHDVDAFEEELLHLIADQLLNPVVMQIFGEGISEAKAVVGLTDGDSARGGGKLPPFRLDVDGGIECGTDDQGLRFEKMCCRQVRGSGCRA